MITRRPPKRVVRFGLTERAFHWAQALPYLTLLCSGGLLLAQRQMQHELVPAATLILAHKICGVLMPALLLLVLVIGDTRALLRNFLSVALWPLKGLLGLVLATVSFLIPHTSTAPPAKFNAGQKFHMLALMLLVPLFLVSGLFMWLRPGELLAWYVHVIAFLITTPMVLGHLFMALLHPVKRKGLSGMFSGKVDARWARKEYGLPTQQKVRQSRRP